MEDARKQELLKMSPKPIHGILVNNEPKDPKVKEKRDFVKKVIILEWMWIKSRLVTVAQILVIDRKLILFVISGNWYQSSYLVITAENIFI